MMISGPASRQRVSALPFEGRQRPILPWQQTVLLDVANL